MGKKLLIVDDKKEIRGLVRATLEVEGWEILEADTGDEAVAAAGRDAPGLVIMDMFMPGGIDGLEATRRIKAGSDTADIKIVMLTGGSEESLREDALAAGADEFIYKPFSPLDLLDTVEALFTAKGD